MTPRAPWNRFWSCRRGRLATAKVMPRGRRITRSRKVSRQGSCRRAEDVRQLERRRDLQLIVRAVLGALVGPPALKDGGVAKPIALQVVVLHFAHALDAQWLPRQILAGAPA